MCYGFKCVQYKNKDKKQFSLVFKIRDHKISKNEIKIAMIQFFLHTKKKYIGFA